MNLDFDRYVETEDALFHYTKISVAIEILFDRKFRLSQLKNTNDPTEYQDMFFSMVCYDSNRQASVPRFNEVAEVINQIMKSEHRVMCFCSNRKPTIIKEDGLTIGDDLAHSKGWNRARMWAQYAENHSGVCLVFSKKGLEEKLKDQRFRDTVSKAGYVEYASIENLSLRINQIDGDKLVEGDIRSHAEKYVLDNLENLFFLKPVDYRDESEYRLAVYDPKAEFEYIDIEPMICGVIVGDKISRAYSAVIKYLCDGLKIDSKKVFWERGRAHLVKIKSTLEYWSQ